MILELRGVEGGGGEDKPLWPYLCVSLLAPTTAKEGDWKKARRVASVAAIVEEGRETVRGTLREAVWLRNRGDAKVGAFLMAIRADLRKYRDICAVSRVCGWVVRVVCRK